MASGTVGWFASQELSWRITGAVFWACFLGCSWTVVASFGLVYLQTPLLPLSVVLSMIGNLFKMSSIFYISLVGLFIFSWAKFQAKHISVIPSVEKSVVWCIGQALQTYPLSFFHFIGIGFCLSWCLLNLCSTPYSSLRTPCSTQSTRLCYNQQHIFLLLAGAYSGLLEAAEFHFRNGNFVNLPIIGLDKYTQVKLKIQPRLGSLLMSSLNSLKYLYAGYLVASVLGGSIYSPAGLSYAEMASPVLAVSCCLLVFYVKVVNVSIMSCISVYCSAPLHLELPNLIEGANAKDDHLLATLCLQDMSDQLSDRVDVRREVFALSLPGGHPHSWNSILDICKRNFGGLSKDISNLISPPPPSTEVEEEPIPAAITLLSPNMRRLAPLSPIKQETKEEKVKSPSFGEKLVGWWPGVLESLKKRPLVGWLVKEPSDLQYRLIFAKSQAAIFSVEVMSHIVSASLTEDSYGVVQKDLEQILTSLLTLEQNIDRCRGQGLVYRKKTGDLPDIHLKQELKCAVKSAIFRIVISFKDHILAVPLSPEFRQKMHNYKNFMEA